ncbi:MAG: hypothetical protein ACTSSK_12390 [Candidatus Heimdallarchaeota archaeon]
MIKQLKKDIIENIQKIIQISLVDIESVLPTLESFLEEITSYIATVLDLEPIHPRRKITLDMINENSGVNLGVKRTETAIIIQKWIFELQQRAKGYMLTFVIVKESLMLFFKEELNELEESIINIATILWLKQLYNIKALDNPIFASIDSWIYPETISGIDYNLISNLQVILFIKNISFNEVITTYLKIKQEFNPDENELYNKIREWVQSFVKDDDVIAPIYVRSRLMPIIDNLLEFGYEKGSSSVIAKKLNVHENTTRNYFREMMTNYATFWRPLISFERFKLHKYFFKIKIKDQTKYDQIYDLLWNIPYLKTLYVGEENGQQILYSPSLICPHLISEQINERLRKFEANGIIDYTLQLIRERYIVGAITSNYFTPSIKTFRDLLSKKPMKLEIKKLTFSEEKRDASMEFDDDDIPFDFNLLYFLSILRNKYLLKSRYGVMVSELPKFFEINNIAISDVVSQTDFINQIEIRARRRNLLSYALYMRSHRPRGSDVLIFEILNIENYTDKKFEQLREQLNVFSFLGVVYLSDRILFTLPGVSYEHPIKEVIEEILAEEKMESLFYTINLSKAKFVPLHELYDFDTQKWK